ncbi:MAG: ADP-ribosylglycohydrolase family protein [Chloroflexi bacterium]|uniref:ADP-ribosylglycohydrolase family protein n=1 Tax=Candidatus Chlorohelix allophototropha TaxID=3003348 RepID=A0A8T7M735_9CHLR|nr:ADP-ribosylglycohydrolase family protein [Chloroflexota bacterium]WJW69862.1 ADP-ribosylglycohydrolase family protein [Chloroflexota bacterium L227-S17]
MTNYLDNFKGALLGFSLNSANQTSAVFESLRAGLRAGLYKVFAPLTEEDKALARQPADPLKVAQALGIADTTQAMLVFESQILLGHAVRLMCRHELLPEDLMSAVIDFLPPGGIFENPLRAKLLVAQDYLEERQTLVDNMLAGDLELDLLEIDGRNARRCGAGANIEEAVAAAFYAVTARKNSFEEAVTVALSAGNPTLSAAICGAIAGAYHGIKAIPTEWLDKLEIRAIIEETARELHANSIKNIEKDTQ